jgi:pimeloyl-ACP methyl ester carboxylesterase
MASAREIPEPGNYYTEPTFIDVNGLQTAYRRKGKGEAVLFLHGASSTRMWLPMYERFADSVDFIAPEHPGFGATDRPDWLESFNDLVIHYDQFLAELNIDRLHLVGWSLGGWTAAELASYYPRILKSLTLIVPIGLRLRDNPGVDIFQLLPEELVDLLFNDKDAIAAVAPDPGNFEEICQAHYEASTFAKLIWSPRYNLALEHRLQRLQCPTLVVKAEDDRLVPNEMADRFAEVIPGAKTATIPETGHALCIERPNETADAILAFIKESGNE